MTLNSEQQFPRGYLDPGFLPWVPAGEPAEDGERLFDWLVADEALKMAWAEVRGQRPQRRIRLRIDATAPELHAIPWELLRDAADGAPAQDLAATYATPFSRYLAGRWQPGGPVLQRPVKVLVAIASPDNLADYDLAALDVDQEWQLLQEATADQDDIELTLLDQPCTLAALEGTLKEGYHALHFVGHGAYREKGGQGKAVLYLADDQNQVALVYDEDVAGMLDRQLAHSDLLVDDRLRMVFLASCQTATRSPADAFRGLAPRLVAAGVPAVVAMQDLVPIDTARQFASTFYRQLLAHGQVDLASNEARSAIRRGYTGLVQPPAIQSAFGQTGAHQQR
jgi:CHAT domain-containing protein